MTRVVVIGNGMVGSRFVDELLRTDERFEVTVLGAEEYEPYNRVLLSEVVAGKVDVASLTLPRVGLRGVQVLSGVVAASIDRSERTITSTDGQEFGYDVLVLATGARARVPELAGLTADGIADEDATDALPAGVHALRTLDDAREIVAATVNARRAVVLGAGVLGLEAACGLARRGLNVTVVHRGSHVMDRQLDTDAAAAVTHGLRRLGIDHRVGAATEEVLVSGGRLSGVRLADGERLPADLLVLTAGTIPQTGLAERAGLEVDRGVVVGADCATSDRAVYAIGDCAQPPEGGTGLIAQGWDQARRLAGHLADAGSVDHAHDTPMMYGTDVVRVKAHGLEIVAMGARIPPQGPHAPHRTIRLSDPAIGRHVEIVVSDGVVVGATCVGASALGADLTTAYTRRTPTPADPAQLLFKPVRGAATSAGAEPSPTLMPDRATVCRCNGVTKGDLVTSWRGGARSLDAIATATRATTGCGGCKDSVCGLLEWLERSDPSNEGGEGADGGTSGTGGTASEGSGSPNPTDAPATIPTPARNNSLVP
ncbi:FAD-dependent oxidoreductase [Pengzhenrongella sp.]|jgi:assimilatory nitrate reductase electron transfer subunit|uniref:FAD-dependent oxidoreductase n=1 Tax=Pengzhenrongella sp. TaxID=2888820 RepID=UPI002F94B69D